MDECACHILYRFKLLTLIIPLFLIRRNPPPPVLCTDWQCGTYYSSWEIRTCQRILRWKPHIMQLGYSLVMYCWYYIIMHDFWWSWTHSNVCHAQIYRNEKCFHGWGLRGGGLREIFVFHAYLAIFSNFKTNSLNFPGVGGGGSSWLSPFSRSAHAWSL